MIPVVVVIVGCEGGGACTIAVVGGAAENICDILDSAMAAVDRGENNFGSDASAAAVDAVVVEGGSFVVVVLRLLPWSDGDVMMSMVVLPLFRPCVGECIRSVIFYMRINVYIYVCVSFSRIVAINGETYTQTPFQYDALNKYFP